MNMIHKFYAWTKNEYFFQELGQLASLVNSINFLIILIRIKSTVHVTCSGINLGYTYYAHWSLIHTNFRNISDFFVELKKVQPEITLYIFLAYSLGHE